jgi:TatD DNase family protein
MQLIDTHAHIQEPEFKDDIADVLLRAQDAGVESIVVPGVDLETSLAAAGLAREHAGLFAAAGFHPHEASRLDAHALEQIEALLGQPEVVAVGEIGLDYFRMHSPRQAQVEVFEQMLVLAGRYSLPVSVHCRDAWDDMASILLPWAQRMAPRYSGEPMGVLHYFSSSLEEARRYAEHGFVISIHTSVTHPKSVSLREVAAGLPLDKLVVETDSPYGAPQAFRGRRNEPSYVVEAASAIAALHSVSLDDVATQTTANARRLFRLPVATSAQAGAV